MKRILFTLIAILGITFLPPSSFANEQYLSVHTHAKKDITVYITRTGGKYHSSGCSYLRRSSIAIKRKSAIAQGYTACSRCW